MKHATLLAALVAASLLAACGGGDQLADIDDATAPVPATVPGTPAECPPAPIVEEGRERLPASPCHAHTR